MKDLQLFQNLPFQALDIAIILLILISAIFAYVRGFVHEILAVTGWVGAILATYFGIPFVRPYVKAMFISGPQSSTYEIALDFGIGLVIFILTLVLLSFLSRSISQQIQRSILRSLDRALGFLFGIFRGGFLVCILFIFLEVFFGPNYKPKWLTSAKSIDLVVRGAEIIRLAIPENLVDNRAFDLGKRAKSNSQDILDATRAVNNLISPQPEGKTKKLDGGYGQKERQDMERLIDANQTKRKED